MLKVFISSHCPDCPEPLKKLKDENLNFKLIDITNSMAELKEFLKIRDSHPYFNEIKRNNKVGVPTVFIPESEEVLSLEGDVDYEYLRKYSE